MTNERVDAVDAKGEGRALVPAGARRVPVVDYEGRALVPAGARRVPVVDYGEEGVAVNPAVFQPPILRLRQKDEGAGAFYRLDTGETFGEVEAVPLLIQMGRLKWPKGGFRRDAKPECWSLDGLQADTRPSLAGRMAVYAGHSCSTCPFYTNRVSLDAAGREKGICAIVHAAILYDAARGESYILRLSGMLNLDVPSLLGPKRAPHIRRQRLRLGSYKVEGERGTYYRLAILGKESLTEEERAEMSDLFEAARSWELALRGEEFEAGGEGLESDPPEGSIDAGPHPADIREGSPGSHPAEEEALF